MQEGRSAFKMLTGTLTGKSPLRRWEGNNRMDLKEIGINTRNWIDSAQDRDLLSSPCECGIQRPGSINHGIS